MKQLNDNRESFRRFQNLDPYTLFRDVKTPCFIIDKASLIHNGEILKKVQEETGCKILLAQKAFSNFNLYPLLEKYVAGTEASGLYEAKLGKEEMPEREVHVFSCAYRQEEFDELLEYADHIVFNSISQLKKYGAKAKSKGKSIGIRINPECSTQVGHDIYNPCAPGSRLGVTISAFEEGMDDNLLYMLDGIHFHTLCQQNSDDLEKTLKAVKTKFGKYLSHMKWINFGGGHHITRSDYDLCLLEKCIKEIQDEYHLQVYLEPGEAIVLNAGYLISKVLDTFDNGSYHIAILDTSAACHMPDVLEMPYKPPLFQADVKGCSYPIRLGSQTCLSGDMMGDYLFSSPLQEKDMLIFGDMALYTTCKTNTFNGMPLPDILVLNPDNTFETLCHFGYHDFKYRLGKEGKHENENL